MRHLLPYILIGLALMWIASQTGVPVVGDVLPELVDVVSRGARLTTAAVDASGIVTTPDYELLSQAAAVVGRDVDRDAYSLARMVRSEEGAAGQIAKTYLCHVMMNQADAAGLGITEIIQRHNQAARNGHYGAQISGAVASGQDPYESDLAAAEYALSQRANGDDPTAGATNFVDKRAFGVQAGTSTFDDLVSRWGADGRAPGNLPDASPNLVFFWRGSVPDVAQALA